MPSDFLKEEKNRLDETKVLRDPVHGYIHIDLPVIWNLIDTPEFQRLRRIRQLGGDIQVYHAGEHSRFAHSLGVYELARRMIEEVDGLKESLDELHYTAGLCTALLHDLGHGPLSHCFEEIAQISHEQMTISLILDERTAVNRVLKAQDRRLPALCASILAHQSDCPLLEDLISSQLDCDRMDYLLRDAYMTGTKYGSFDLERVLRTMRVVDGKLCIKHSGMHSVEDYIMARYQMYWQVYLHPDAAGYELLLITFFKRYGQIRLQKENQIALLEPVFDLEFDPVRYCLLDDFSLMTGIVQAQGSPDPILADLAFRLASRRLLAWMEKPTVSQIEAIEERLKAQGMDPAFYLHIKAMRHEEYLPYREDESRPIRIVENGRLHDLSECSAVARALLEMKNSASWRLYYPKNLDIHSQSAGKDRNFPTES